jgi:hypothetical protein
VLCTGARGEPIDFDRITPCAFHPAVVAGGFD